MPLPCPDLAAVRAALSPAVRTALDALAALAADRAGTPGDDERRSAWLFGETLAALLRGGRPRGPAVLVDLAPGRILEALPGAVPTDPFGRRFAVGTATGAIDVLVWPEATPLRRVLEAQAFGAHALALAWQGSGGLVDPFDGLADLEVSRIRWIGDPKAMLARAPVLAWVAARVVSEEGLEPDPDLAVAIRAAAPTSDGIASTRLRRELTRLLLGAAPERGIALLRESGAAQALLAGLRGDAGAVVAALPERLPLRLAALLRGSSTTRVLRRLQAPRPLAARTAELLAAHPLDTNPAVAREPGLRRLLARLGRADFDGLLRMREAELAPLAGPARPAIETARGRLARLRITADRIEARARTSATQARLALDGNRVMVLLGCGPGRRVGAALRHLAECVAADPERNTTEALETLLERWAASNPAS